MREIPALGGKRLSEAALEVAPPATTSPATSAN